MPKNARGAKRGGKKEKPEFEQKLLDLARVTRVVKGGRRFRFRATLAIGDRSGRVGLGVAKGSDVSGAIGKAYTQAKKSLVSLNMHNTTIPHDIQSKFGSAKVILKPASEGRGLIAGGAVRVVVELAGIRDIVTKSIGASNKINVAKATILALSMLKKPKKSSQKPLENETLAPQADASPEEPVKEQPKALRRKKTVAPKNKTVQASK